MLSPPRRLALASVLSVAVPAFCWVLTAGTGRIPLWLPYVSDLALVEPAATLFPLGLTTIALLHLGLIGSMRAVLDTRIGDGLLVVSAIGTLGVAWFDWLHWPTIHYAAAALLFGGYASWVLLACHRNGASPLQRALLLIVAHLTVLLLALSLSVGEVPASAEDLAWQARPWSMTAAAAIEWLLVLALGLVGLTFSERLELTSRPRHRPR